MRNLARRLEHDAPGVSGSILEGLDEILTVIRLGLPPQLRHSLAWHQRHRERDRHRPDGAAERQALAQRRDGAALDRRRPLGGAKDLPPPQGPTASSPVLDAALREAVRKAGAKSVIEDIEVAA